YVDDLSLPGMWFGHTVRSQVARGRLRAIRRDPSFDWSAVVVVSATDIPGANAIKLIENDQPALVPLQGEIRHADEPVVLVAAASRRLAREAAAHISLEVDELPAVLDIDAALRADIKLHGSDN